jgi:hypothetical protein
MDSAPPNRNRTDEERNLYNSVTSLRVLANHAAGIGARGEYSQKLYDFYKTAVPQLLARINELNKKDGWDLLDDYDELKSIIAQLKDAEEVYRQFGKPISKMTYTERLGAMITIARQKGYLTKEVARRLYNTLTDRKFIALVTIYIAFHFSPIGPTTDVFFAAIGLALLGRDAYKAGDLLGLWLGIATDAKTYADLQRGAGVFGEAYNIVVGNAILAAAAKKFQDMFCFLAGTTVQTAKGLVPIESVDVGTLVWAFDVHDCEWRLCRVRRQLGHEYTGQIITVTIGKDRIQATELHPFWVVSGESLANRPLADHIHDYEMVPVQMGRWVSARDLRPGDQLLLRTDNETATITSIVVHEDQCVVYNICVEENHTFAVGVGGILVHNTGGTTPKQARLSEADLTPGMILDPSKHQVFRGGSSMEARPGIDVKVGKDGLIQPTKPNGKPQGISVNIDPANPNVASRGVYQVESVPEGLTIIRDGNTGHFVIAPTKPMTPAEYQALLNQVKTVLVEPPR